ncbi:16S rRNA (guanine(527)-N(7))-methyltransferase RsmG [Acidiphilium sp. AL]|uniref:Ribosomal RNA small subunit methyltransferase G n=1 Tax=Acidiphilium iwatense TaxID=768198 RepID=A0ABS9DUD8_9PROT|nr:MULTISPECIES: 16S rRNA (guanine(527)-N(7))-methyltransferase RsmG [Acidiphilium]MCF3946348.1 16S rRNA (guanine(527)-N(7))-methyltransferase RsmG [Acidiphilium iwatense]MCU4159868.1 16S rRNA (guanine(527)-N(7))-methyltransferase RsmG [Acidiphilium sp. AL]
MAIEAEKKVRFGSFVSRETKEPLRYYSISIKKWTERINLIARKDANDEAIWQRHILDSLQLLPLIPSDVDCAADLGSGAGLPGLVLAIERPDIHVTLIEADRRKAAFLQTMVAELGLNAAVIAERIEKATVAPVKLVTARALAPLPALLEYAHPLLAEGGVCLFPKGRGMETELTAAVLQWHMRVERFPSQTDADATILRISELRRAA